MNFYKKLMSIQRDVLRLCTILLVLYVGVVCIGLFFHSELSLNILFYGFSISYLLFYFAAGLFVSLMHTVGVAIKIIYSMMKVSLKKNINNRAYNSTV